MMTNIIYRKVLEEIAGRYERRKAGRTGEGKQRMLLEIEELLRSVQASEGVARAQAVEQLRWAERAGWIRLLSHPRDRDWIQEVQLLPEGESGLFGALKALSPSSRRQAWQNLFLKYSGVQVPEQVREDWITWCGGLASDALAGAVKSPFRWKELEAGEELLRVLSGALSWPGESLIRFASCVLCGDSKRVELLAPRLNEALSQLTGGRLTILDQLGLLRIPRVVLVHGPLVLQLPGGTMDLGLLQAPVWISEADLQAASMVTTAAKRLLTVENETTMQELAKLRSGILLVHTSYPSSAVLTLVRRLPVELPAWHFGDSDPAGYDILRVLRERTGRNIDPLHMRFRPRSPSPPVTPEDLQILMRVLDHPLMGDIQPELTAIRGSGFKGDFEQESLGWPQPHWPFY